MIHERLCGQRPRPPVPLHLDGAPLLEIFPVVPIMGNLTVGSARSPTPGSSILPSLPAETPGPDVQVFADAARNSLDQLARSIRDAS